MHCDSQLCLRWLQPAHLWIPAYLTARKSCHTLMHRNQYATFCKQTRNTANCSTRSLFCLSLLLQIWKKAVWEFWLSVKLMLFIVQGQKSDICVCFVSEHKLSLSADLFSLWCALLLCHSFRLVWERKSLKWHNDTPAALLYCLTN